MDLALGAATVAVSRAGASSLAEIAAMRLPSLLIPFPAAADNHQFHNARAFETTGAARLLEQKDATPERVAAILRELVENETARASMQTALARWHAPRAAEQIAENILSACWSSSFSLPKENRLKPGLQPPSIWRTETGTRWRRMNTILEMPAPNRVDIAGELAGCVSRNTVVRRDEPLAKHTTLRVGGPADVYVEPASEADLAGVVKIVPRPRGALVCAGPRLEFAGARRRFSRRGCLSGARVFRPD